jgi:hypothetical protein
MKECIVHIYILLLAHSILASTFFILCSLLKLTTYFGTNPKKRCSDGKLFFKYFKFNIYLDVVCSNLGLNELK